MKKFLILLVALTASVGMMSAQDKGKKSKDEMLREFKEFKMKFLAQEIDLKDEQQKPFFELYDQMMAERHKVYEQTRRLERKVKKDASASDEDYAALSKAMTDAKQKDAEIERTYDAKFATVLNNKQIFKLKTAEDKFRQKMHEMRKKKKKNQR